MAYGPPPQPDKRRANDDTFKGFEVEVGDGAVVAPDLPHRVDYLQETCDWYDNWASSPQAEAFLVTDWQRLHMLAALVDQYWREPSTKTLAEIRQSESLLGATHVDRMRGRIKVKSPARADDTPGKASGNVTPISSRRERLLSGDA